MRINRPFRSCLLGFAFSAGLLTSCQQDTPLPDVRENELITTIRLKLVNQANAADIQVATWKDLDGEGGTPPSIDPINLKTNARYALSIDAILNETASKSENVRDEIIAEATNHLFVYKPLGDRLTVTITDTDSRGLPFGLQARLTTGTSTTGSLRIILRHQVGTKDGTEAPGSTDIDTSFPLTVQ